MSIATESPKLTEIATGSSKVVAMSPNRRLHFTKAAIEKLPSPPGAQAAYYYDTHTPGLALRVSPGGSRTFVLYRKIAGRPERVKIGRFPDLSIEQARREADKLKGAIAGGKNPAAERRAIRSEMTLDHLFTEYLERYAKHEKRTWEDDKLQFDAHLHGWRLRQLSSIRRSDVLALHAKLGRDSGHYAANRLLALLRSMFNKAIDWGWEGVNPAARIKGFRETKRERFLLPEEMPRFLRAVQTDSDTDARDFFMLLLFTGARRGNVQAMRWEEVNLAGRLWTIPADKAKAGDILQVVLVPEAVKILRRRKSTSKSDWVFPSETERGYQVEWRRAWRRILANAEVADVRMHDLRRTLGSWQAATGASLPVIGKTLGHRNQATTAIYARLNLDPVRQSVGKATSAMLRTVRKNGVRNGR